jgi:response regulator RpfG family c-di-GMP phosphodiesterase
MIFRRECRVSSFLVVGEDADVRETLSVPLRAEGHNVTLVSTGSDAIGILRNSPIDTVIIVGGESDVAASKLRGRILNEKLAPRVFVVQPFVAKHGAHKVRRFGISDHRLSGNELLALLRSSDETAPKEGGSPNDKVYESLVQVIDVLVALQELNSPSFRGSSHRAVHLARAVAEKMNLSQSETAEIVLATLLKDIGNAGVSETLFEDVGMFSMTQHELMRQHVMASVGLLEHIDFPWKVLPIIRHHHERYDGSGYPDGFKGPEIPVGARILAAVDAYVAMLSSRPHRPCMTASDAKKELVSLAGTQFDPEVVEVLLQAIGQCAVGLNSAEKPVVLIADSDREFVKMLAMRLVNEGLEVRGISNAEEALTTILDRPPHIVLVSAAPDADGALRLVEKVREDRKLRLLPILLMVDRDDRILRTRALRIGVDDVLRKGGDLQDIVVKVERILAREAARRSPEEEHGATGITGRLENLALHEIFQILNLGVKTARLTLNAQGEVGTIWFAGGSAIHADLGGKLGVEACYDMLRWNVGEFRIEHGVTTDMETIQMDPMMVVMEGLRLLDESGAHLGDQPVR